MKFDGEINPTPDGKLAGHLNLGSSQVQFTLLPSDIAELTGIAQAFTPKPDGSLPSPSPGT